MMKKKRLFQVLTIMLPLLFFSIWSFGQSITVSGTVSDENNDPMIGVNIVVKGTTTGTITDVNGHYSLSVPSSESILVFTFIGYSPEEAIVAGRSEINMNMMLDLVSLGDVVVVGYGTQRKEAVTGSVATLKGDEMRDVPSSNISNALQGRVSGVEMSQTSSKPGSAMQIRIRGTRSLKASNDPLIVLDGIPFAGSLTDINPADIKSLDILKDASATAIYGSRGANGVIIITTNKGTMGQKAQFTYSGYTGVKTIFAKYPMMDGPEFAKLRQTAGMYGNTVDESNETNTDWQDLLYDNGMVTSHDIGVTGGTQKGNYSFGTGYYKEEAVVPLQDYTRISIRGSLDQGLGEYIRVGFITNSNFSITNGNNLGAVWSALSSSPIANPYNADGSLKDIIQQQTSGAQWVSTRSRLESLGDGYIDQTKAIGSYNTMYGEVAIPGIEGLKYRINLGLNYRTSSGGSYTGQGVFSGNPDNLSTASISNDLRTNWAVENLLTYDRTFAAKHKINVVGLYSAEETMYNRSYVTAKDIPADFFQFYNLGRAEGEIKIDPKDQYYWKRGLLSWMGRAMYSYDDRYMLSLTFRSDGASALAEGNQWHTYPAVSAGWNIAKESFMSNISQISNLKLRVGYGQTSNQSVDPYKTFGLLNTRPYNFGNEYATGYYVSELPNPDLGWEYSVTWNYGLDFGAFNNRLTGTFEYYVQNTKDVLLPVGLPGSTGASSYMANIGETQNKGFELSLQGTIIEDKNGWSWDLGLNIYANHNKLVALASGQTRDEANWWFVGHPIDVVYDYEKVGLWNESDADYQYLQNYEPGGNAGMIKVKYTGEYNADGSPVRSIGTADRQIIDLEPKFQGGFNTRVAYKNFDLTMVGAFKAGGILISNLYSSAGYLNTLNGRAGNNIDVDYWTPENTGAKYPKPGGLQSSDNPKYGSTLGYFNASYLKIRALTLGYNVKKEWSKKVGIENFRVYATVQNPFVLFSPYKKESGMDPETNSYGNENAAVSYSENLKRLLTISPSTPSTRNYLIGISLNF